MANLTEFLPTDRVSADNFNENIVTPMNGFMAETAGTHGTLPARLNSVDAQLADKASLTALAAQASGSPKAQFGSLALLQADATANTTLGKTSIYLVLPFAGTAEVDTLTVTAIPTVASNITVTLNGVAKTVALLTTDNTTTLVATKIRAATYTGWTTGGTAEVVTFTKTTVGVNTTPTFSGGTTGCTATIVATTAGVALRTGDWYYWDGSVWVDGGIYQATGIANNSVRGEKLGKTYSLLDQAIINAGKRLTGYDGNGIVSLSTIASYNTYQLILPSKGKLKIFKSTMASGMILTVHNSMGIGMASVGYNEPNGVSTTYKWLEIFSNYFTIDIKLLKEQFSDAFSFYTETYVSDNLNYYIEGQNIISLDDYEWIDKTDFVDTKALKNKMVTPIKLSDSCNLIDAATLLLGHRANGYTGDGTLVNPAVSIYFLATILLPTTGTLRIKNSTVAVGSRIVFISGGLGVTFIGFDFLPTHSFFKVYSEYIEIDVMDLKNQYPNCDSLQATFTMTDFSTAYIYGIGTQTLEWLNTKPTINPVIQDKLIVLPPNIPCVIDKEIHIYLDNILQYGNAYKAERMEVKNKGDLFEYGYEYKPITGYTAETINVDYYTGKTIGLTGSTVLKPVLANAGSGLTKKVIIIGESTSDNAVFMGELGNLFTSDAMHVNLIGTRGTPPNMNEARAGWQSGWFNTLQQAGSPSVINAFFNPLTSLFDFSYYMTQQAFPDVDYVCINLGLNDADANLTPATVIANYTLMINSIRAFNSNIKIFIGLSNLPEKFGNTGMKYLKDRLLEIIKALILQYGNRESEGYFLTPIYTNIDPYWDMQYTDRAMSARNSKTTTIGTNGVHPSTIGYYKMADTHYHVFKYAASLG